MKYIKLFEHYQYPTSSYASLQYGFVGIFMYDIEFLCNILPIKYEIFSKNIHSQVFKKRVIDKEYHMKLSNINNSYDFVIITRYNPEFGRVLAHSTMPTLLSIVNYSELVQRILHNIVFTDEQWISILEKHPEFYAYLKEDYLDNYIPKNIKEKFDYLKNELF